MYNKVILILKLIVKIIIDQGNKPMLLPVRIKLGNINILLKDFYFKVTPYSYLATGY